MRTALRIDDGVAWIIIDDGKVNAMSCEMLEEIAGRLDEARSCDGPVVVQGRPGIFSAGFDLKTFTRGVDASLAMVRAGAELIRRILGHPRPVLAVCTGHAYPMGAFLLLAADVRIGLSGPWKIGMNEVAIGLTVPHFAIALARHRLAPPAVAGISSGVMVDPQTAVRYGYLDHAVGLEDLDTVIGGELTRLKALDWKAYEATKLRLNGGVSGAIAEAIAEYRPSAAA